MSQIPAEGLNHYAVVWPMSTKMKNKVAAHWSTYWNTMEDCFTNIFAYSAGYEGA